MYHLCLLLRTYWQPLDDRESKQHYFHYFTSQSKGNCFVSLWFIQSCIQIMVVHWKRYPVLIVHDFFFLATRVLNIGRNVMPFSLSYCICSRFIHISLFVLFVNFFFTFIYGPYSFFTSVSISFLLWVPLWVRCVLKHMKGEGCKIMVLGSGFANKMEWIFQECF